MSQIVDYNSVVDDRDAARWVPLRVSCRVTTPIIYYGDGMNLDGLLAFGAYHELPEDVRDSLPPMGNPWCDDFELPVAKWSAPLPDGSRADPRLLTPDGEVWGWCTSDVEATWEGRQPYDLRKMPATDAMRRLTRDAVVNTTNGRFKGSNLRYEGWWPQSGELAWYVLGDAAGVRELLKHLPNIGKLHNHGYGKIECELNGAPIWHVEEISDDRSIEHNGHLTRSMPAGYGQRKGTGSPKPIRAPRHHRSRYIACIGTGG